VLTAQRDEDPAIALTVKEEVAANNAIIDAAWNDYFPERVSDEVERQIANSFNASIGGLRAAIEDVNAAMINNDFATATEIAATTLSTEYPKVLNPIEELLDRNRVQAAAANQQSMEEYYLTRNIVIGVMLATVLAGILLAVWLTRGIMRPLSQAQIIANAMAEGKLGNQIDITAKMSLATC